MTQKDEGNMLAPMWLFDHVAACIRKGDATEQMAQNIECLRGGMEAQAARIAELETKLQAVLRREEDANRAAFAHMRRITALEANGIAARKATAKNYARAEAAEAALAEMTRRRDEWRKKAEGYDAVRLALREKVGSPWPPHMSRLLWAGIAADEKKRADDAEAEVARLREALGDALDAWDTHNETGDMMQGYWVSDARAALAKKEAGE